MSERPLTVGTGVGSARARIEHELQEPNRAVFSASGELDLHVAPELQDRMDAAIEEGAELIVIDLSGVTFVDSMALGVLLGSLNRLRRRGGNLRLVVPDPDLRRIFEITQLDRLFTLHGTREDALVQPAPPL